MSTEQPLSIGNGDIVLAKVISDLASRAVDGTLKYGNLLRTNNGRRALRDLREELQDALMYITRLEMEVEKEDDLA